MGILKSGSITPVGASPGLGPWDSAAMYLLELPLVPSSISPTKAARPCNAAKLNSEEMELK